MAALEEGGAIAWATFIILVIMSAGSWYVLFVKLFEQQKIINQGTPRPDQLLAIGQSARGRLEAREEQRLPRRSSTTASSPSSSMTS